MCKKIMYFIADIYPFDLSYYKFFLIGIFGLLVMVLITNLDLSLKAKIIEAIFLFAAPAGIKKWLTIEDNHESTIFNIFCVMDIVAIGMLFLLLLL